MVSLENRRVLIVEDDMLQATGLAWHFAEMGAKVVGPATSIAAGLRLAPRADMAILDINVSGEVVFPVADTLYARGVPIVFYSGYSDIRIPERFHFASRLAKPASTYRIEQTVKAALGSTHHGPDDVVELLPRLRLAALLLLNETRAADRLVEETLEQAIETGQPEEEALGGWLNRLLHDIAQERGRQMLT